MRAAQQSLFFDSDCQSIDSLRGRLEYPAYHEIYSTYLICEIDEASPAEQQESMIQNSKSVNNTMGCCSGHFPMLLMPHAVVEVIESIPHVE
jgi:hypothetical protein